MSRQNRRKETQNIKKDPGRAIVVCSAGIL